MNYNASLDKQKKLRVMIDLASFCIPVAVAILLNPRMPKLQLGEWSGYLPHINGIVNTLTSILILVGLYFIKNKNVVKHRNTMLIAVVLGCFFLASYILYHVSHDSTPFGGKGWIRSIYYFFLITHIILSVVVVRFVLLALYYAVTDQIGRHKKIVRWAYPIWLYVSITGVIVYLMIKPYYT